MALAPGTRLGPYEIASQIGMGGMGEVYRATDTNLKRQVAIKVLPDAVATDASDWPGSSAKREVLASLNHPNIAAIYGLEKIDGTAAIVMELVEGPTLADRIAKGPIPLDEALPIARQIAEALEAAHEQGIIHRDLKPANIKLRSDGTVKVLDFGLAKALDPPGAMSPSVTQSPTITSPAVLTGVGVLLGTPAYMSPEQARGQALDKRTDIWSFGCVLYEMLTGRRGIRRRDPFGHHRGDPGTRAVMAGIARRNPAGHLSPPAAVSPQRSETASAGHWRRADRVGQSVATRWAPGDCERAGTPWPSEAVLRGIDGSVRIGSDRHRTPVFRHRRIHGGAGKTGNGSGARYSGRWHYGESSLVERWRLVGVRLRPRWNGQSRHLGTTNCRQRAVSTDP